MTHSLRIQPLANLFRDYQIYLNWRDENPIQKNKNLLLTQFSLDNYWLENECVAEYITGNFSCLQGKEFEKKFKKGTVVLSSQTLVKVMLF